MEMPFQCRAKIIFSENSKQRHGWENKQRSQWKDNKGVKNSESNCSWKMKTQLFISIICRNVMNENLMGLQEDQKENCTLPATSSLCLQSFPFIFNLNESDEKESLLIRATKDNFACITERWCKKQRKIPRVSGENEQKIFPHQKIAF